jgi:acyl carrier protein
MSNGAQIDAVVLDILSEVLREPADEFQREPVLAAHAWTSLASLEVLAQLEDQLGIELDLRAFNAVRTVKALVEFARAGLGTAAATAAQAP